jgi:hypothetical protein
MLVGNAGMGGYVRRRARACDERREPGEVVGVHVRLEDRDDRAADGFSGGEIVIDEVDVGVDDGQLSEGEAAEQITGARSSLVQEGSE